MDIKVCERCGATSQQEGSNISKLSVRARQNGDEEACMDVSIEACKACRQAIQYEIKALCAPENLSIHITRPARIRAEEAKPAKPKP